MSETAKTYDEYQIKCFDAYNVSKALKFKVSYQQK